jgi:hypothetical protein
MSASTDDPAASDTEAPAAGTADESGAVGPDADAAGDDGSEHAASAPRELTQEELLTRDPGLLVWVPTARPAVVSSIETAGLTITEDPSEAVYAIVSTRLPKHRVAEYRDYAIEQSLPVVVMVHPGGEDLAVEALVGGADVAIAEGDSDSLRTLNGEGSSPESRLEALLDAYENRLGRLPSGAGKRIGSLIHPVSGLPSSTVYEARLTEPLPEDSPPIRLMQMSVSGLDGSDPLDLSIDAIQLLHRRLAMAFRAVTISTGQIYDLGSGAFALAAPDLSVEAAENLGVALAAVAENFSPAGLSQLRLSVGHAGVECSGDLSSLAELASRAERAAQASDRSAVVSAIDLIGTMAIATQLDVTLRLTTLATEHNGGPSRDLVADVAADLADRLGFEGREKLMVRFCAHVASIGTVLSNDPDTDPLQVAAKMLGATAGFHVSETVLGLSEHWDGSGGPQGLSGPAIPAPARIVAVAEALVRDSFDLAAITEKSGVTFDPSVVAAAVSHVGAR